MGDLERVIDTGTDELLCSVEGRVATVTLNRPQQRNALSDTLSPALRQVLKVLDEDPDVGCVLLTGAGRAFCAGGDVKGMGGSAAPTGPAPTREQRVATLKERQRTLTGRLYHLAKPTLAALPGPAAGAGLSIALACDLRIAATSAFVTTAYANIGLAGDYGASWLLSQLVGTAKARELFYTSDRVSAQEAERLGIVNRVVPDDELPKAAREWAAQLAAGPAVAHRLMKENLDRALHEDFLTCLDAEAEGMMTSAGTSDHREAVQAFIEKRPPQFRGR